MTGSHLESQRKKFPLSGWDADDRSVGAHCTIAGPVYTHSDVGPVRKFTDGSRIWNVTKSAKILRLNFAVRTRPNQDNRDACQRVRWFFNCHDVLRGESEGARASKPP
jgi:hypothetical protein